MYLPLSLFLSLSLPINLSIFLTYPSFCFPPSSYSALSASLKLFLFGILVVLYFICPFPFIPLSLTLSPSLPATAFKALFERTLSVIIIPNGITPWPFWHFLICFPALFQHLHFYHNCRADFLVALHTTLTLSLSLFLPPSLSFSPFPFSLVLSLSFRQFVVIYKSRPIDPRQPIYSHSVIDSARLPRPPRRLLQRLRSWQLRAINKTLSNAQVINNNKSNSNSNKGEQQIIIFYFLFASGQESRGRGQKEQRGGAVGKAY